MGDRKDSPTSAPPQASQRCVAAAARFTRVVTSRSRFVVAFVLACAVAAFVGNVLAAPEVHTTPTQADPGVPLADHHQHLLSPAAAALQNYMWPPVALPAGLARVMQERAHAWNDKRRLAALYMKGAIVLTAGTPGWLRGRDRVAGYLSTRFASAYGLTPVTYRVSGSSGYIAGYFTRGGKHIGYFMLAVEKARGGKWLISAETPTFPGPRLSEPETAGQLIAYLDEAGIRRAVVLSDAYYFDYADAVAAGDPRTANLYFDLAEVALAAGDSPETLQSIATRMRQIGLKRILYGSDGPVADSMSPKDAWKKAQTLPFTGEELRSIAGNVAPFLR